MLDDSYKWLRSTEEYAAFTSWGDNEGGGSSCRPSCRLLWVAGHAGTGKTMLLIGIVRELSRPLAESSPNVSYFFCQGTDRGLNTANAALRSLVWLLLVQQPHSIHYLQWKHENVGPSLFWGDTAFADLANSFKAMLCDPDLSPVYFIVDGLDECEQGRGDLIKLIVTSLALSEKVRWLVSSSPEVALHRNSGVAVTELKLDPQTPDHPIHLYVDHRLSALKRSCDYDEKTLKEVANVVRQRTNDGFLWLALVFEQLEKASGNQAIDLVTNIPSGLSNLYDHMIRHIERDATTAQYCKSVLLAAAIAYRPLSVSELSILAGLPPEMNTRMAVERCSPFITITDETVYLVHQSAKSHLLQTYSSSLHSDLGLHKAIWISVRAQLKLCHRC